jgi:hypothetical protein
MVAFQADLNAQATAKGEALRRRVAGGSAAGFTG